MAGGLVSYTRKIHTRLPIVTENELGLAFPLRNLPKKFRPDPSTFYLVIVLTNRQTDRQTYAGDYIIPRESFRGDNKYCHHHAGIVRGMKPFWRRRVKAMSRSIDAIAVADRRDT